MSDDPKRREQMRRQRMWMLILMVPWFITLMMLNKASREAQQREAQRKAATEATAQVEAPDPNQAPDTRIQELQRAVEADPKSEQSDRDRLEIAVLYEGMGDVRHAEEAFARFAKERRGTPYAAHAAYHAARIARDSLHDQDLYVKLLRGLSYDYGHAVWDIENKGDRSDAKKKVASELAGGLLDSENAKDIRYRALAFLVGIFNPADHPEYAYACGVMVLGFLVKLLLWPLTSWAYVASKTMSTKMKLIQPMIAELKEKHKDDQMKVMRGQQELMKKYGVSMRSGCLPSILQMVVLIPVYQTVRLYSYPMTHASFLWLASLSKPDIPLLMIYALSFYLSMKLTPQQPSADPQQAQMTKMMSLMMPVMFFFMMQTVPSAFILYWTVFLVFSTGQTLWLAYRWNKQGGDAAVIASLPEELRPKEPKGGRRKLEAAAPERAAGRGQPRGIAAPAVERLGEEIDVGEGRPRPGGGFLARLFAPAIERGGPDPPEDGDGKRETPAPASGGSAPARAASPRGNGTETKRSGASGKRRSTSKKGTRAADRKSRSA
jgi:YidC/Oxa1 family membrane protein insertase